MKVITISCYITLGLLAIIMLIEYKRFTTMLKDESAQSLVKNRTFSLSKTILSFWTIIIFLSICYIGIVNDQLPEIGTGVLTLLGVAIGTAAAGRAIDNTQSQDPTIIRTQDTDTTQGFLIDILSDKNGISISRFQTVFFNLLYASSFIAVVLDEHKLYEFDPTTLALIGVSSGAYALLKIPENKPK